MCSPRWFAWSPDGRVFTFLADGDRGTEALVSEADRCVVSQAETVAVSRSGAGTWTPRKNTNAKIAPAAANAASAAKAQW